MVLTYYNLNITSRYIKYNSMVLAITDSEPHSTDPASIKAARIAGVHQREQDTMPPATRNFPHRGDCGVETLELWEIGIWSDPEKWKLHRIPFKSSKGFGRLLIHKLKVRIFINFLQYFFKHVQYPYGFRVSGSFQPRNSLERWPAGPKSAMKNGTFNNATLHRYSNTKNQWGYDWTGKRSLRPGPIENNNVAANQTIQTVGTDTTEHPNTRSRQSNIIIP